MIPTSRTQSVSVGSPRTPSARQSAPAFAQRRRVQRVDRRRPVREVRLGERGLLCWWRSPTATPPRDPPARNERVVQPAWRTRDRRVDHGPVSRGQVVRGVPVGAAEQPAQRRCRSPRSGREREVEVAPDRATREGAATGPRDRHRGAGALHDPAVRAAAPRDRHASAPDRRSRAASCHSRRPPRGPRPPRPRPAVPSDTSVEVPYGSMRSWMTTLRSGEAAIWNSPAPWKPNLTPSPVAQVGLAPVAEGEAGRSQRERPGGYAGSAADVRRGRATRWRRRRAREVAVMRRRAERASIAPHGGPASLGDSPAAGR